MEDETILRMLPPLRAMWALCGEQAQVPITGRNDQRVLFGTIDVRTGHRVVMNRQYNRQGDFQAFLSHLRRCYGKRPLWLLLDEAPCHVANQSRQIAATLGIELIWLPKQCSELNSMDHLWRGLKADIAANRQFATIQEEVDYAKQWLLTLTPTQARRKAGILSKSFWLRHFLKDFC